MLQTQARRDIAIDVLARKSGRLRSPKLARPLMRHLMSREPISRRRTTTACSLKSTSRLGLFDAASWECCTTVAVATEGCRNFYRTGDVGSIVD